MAKITLIGFYNYDPTLFDGLILPEGIEKDLVVDEILERSNEFESLYSNPDFVKQRITMWGRKHYRTFDKWIKALGIEYDPLNNYDRYEEYTDTHVGNELMSGNRSDVAHNSSQGANDVSRSDNRFNQTSNNTVGQTSGTGSNETTGTENGMNNKQDFSNSLANSHTEGNTKPAEQTTTKEHQVSAYDSSTYQPSEKDTESNVVNHNGTDESDTSSHTGTEGNTREVNVNSHNETGNNAHNELNTNYQNEANVSAGAESEKANNSASDVHTGKELYNDNRVAKDENKHEAHLYGNIGVTTSQQMLESELEVQRFNIYVQIADLFVEDFCIMIY